MYERSEKDTHLKMSSVIDRVKTFALIHYGNKSWPTWRVEKLEKSGRTSDGTPLHPFAATENPMQKLPSCSSRSEFRFIRQSTYARRGKLTFRRGVLVLILIYPSLIYQKILENRDERSADKFICDYS